MAFNFSAWAIRRPVPAVMLFVLLTVAGLLGWRALPVQNFPDIDLPTVTVAVSMPGATPAQLESQVTRKVEDAVASLGQVDSITSTLTDGSSVTTIAFVLEKDSQEAVNDVRDAVSRIRGQLPSGINDPQVTKVKVGGQPVLGYAVEGAGMSAEDLSWFIDNTVTKKLMGVADVANVVRQGGVEREVQVRLDLTKMRSLGLTAGQVSQALRQAQQESSGGTAEVGGLSQSVRALATVQNVAQLGELTVPLGDGRSVKLRDIAQVEDTHAPQASTAYFNDKEVVSFQVQRARGASDVSVATAVRRAVQELAKGHPAVKFTEVTNSVNRIQKSYDGSMHALYEGAALAVLVVFLFLRDWRATIVSAVALPLSVIPTFFALQQFGYSLNTVTLLALTLVVGILVDDAIVEVENIVRHLRMGKPPLQAATKAAQEIGLAVIATTMTLVAVFLPTAFMGGIPGKFFKQFGWTASIAVLASLLVARLLTPMMAAYTLKPHAVNETTGPGIARYLKAMTWCLRHPWRTLAATAVFFAGSLVLYTRVPTEFMAASDNARISIAVSLAPGARYEDTVRITGQARQVLKGIPEVTSVYTTVGASSQGGGPGAVAAPGEVRSGNITLNLTDPSARKRTQKDIELEVRERLAVVPGARFALGVGGSGESYSITLAGDDSAQLTAAAAVLEQGLRSIPGLGAVSSSASLLRPEILVTPRWEAAGAAGVTAETMAAAVRVATAGDLDTALPKLNLPERQLPVRVWAGAPLRQDLEAIRQLRVPGRNGPVALEEVADVALSSGPAQISRRDRERNVTLSVELHGQRLGEVAKLVEALPAFKSLPAGVHLVPTGDLQRMKELFSSFGLAMAAGVLCVYVVLVLLFHSFSQPVTILAALPLSAGGAFGLLALCGYSMSMPVLIGLLMLMGIVTKNSILLVEYAVMAQREHGLTRFEALVDACSKRAQPILMTTIAMAAGMLPVALGLDGDPGFRAPMATAVIGGLVTSTLLSLLVVPVVYEVVDDARRLPARTAAALGRLWARMGQKGRAGA